MTVRLPPSFLFFFFNDTATTEIYTLSLHDALPIYKLASAPWRLGTQDTTGVTNKSADLLRPLLDDLLEDESFLEIFQDRKSTRLNSSHLVISYAVFCLKEKISNRPRS